MDVSYDVVGTLRANAKGHDPIVIDALPFDTTQLTSPQNGSNPHWGDLCHPLAASAHTPSAVVKVFDGIGGFPLVWETAYGAGTAAWASEIEEFPIAVTKKWFGEKEVKS